MISIIVTFYNSEKYLTEALNSILNQTYSNYEVIMVNDGSTDSSRAIALSYTSDPRFILIDSFHVGFPQAKNLGLSNVRGDYIIFLDSDDIVHPQWLEFLMKPVKEHNADISYCNYETFEEKDLPKYSLLDEHNIHIKNMTNEKMCPLLYPGCRNYIWNKLIKKQLYENIVFEDCPAMSDVKVIYKIFDKAKSVYQVYATLNYYRQHSDSIIGQMKKDKSFSEYRLKVILEELIFIFDNYDISKFICRRYLEQELFKLRCDLRNEKKYLCIYNQYKNEIEHILSQEEECDFDVDLVVPYVDSRDKVWQDAYIKYTGRDNFKNNPRFDSPDMFEYFLKGVDKFMPWVRKIHLIVSNIEQVPGYINKEKTHIVLHKDIMPESILPTFNSSTIEMFIHNIEGLSEHFIYSNDDMYPIDYLSKTHFFSKEGKPKIVFKTKYVSDNLSFFNKLCLNVYRHTAQSLNVSYDELIFIRPEHSMSAMILSHCKDCYNKMWNFIKEDLSAFRTTRQHTQYMYLLYEKFTDNYIFDGPTLSYHEENCPIEDILNDIRYRGARIFCLNGTLKFSQEDFSKIKIDIENNLRKQ